MNREKLRELGVDIDGALERLGGNEILLKCLLKEFLVDPNYGKLVDALGEGDTDRAFAAAHTLKGVCTSLSLSRLYEPVSEMTEYLRSGDLASARVQLPTVAQTYGQLAEGLRSCLDAE